MVIELAGSVILAPPCGGIKAAALQSYGFESGCFSGMLEHFVINCVMDSLDTGQESNPLIPHPLHESFSQAFLQYFSGFSPPDMDNHEVERN